VSNLIENAPWLLGLSLIAILGFLVLLAVGLNMMRREAKKDEPAANASAQPESKPAGLPLPAALTERLTPRAAAPADPSANEVLRVLRDRLTGRVLLEINGRRYAQLSEVTDSEVRRALLLTMRDLQEFVGLSGLSAAGAASPTPLSATPTSPAPAVPLSQASAESAPPDTSVLTPPAADAETILSQLNAAPLPKADEAHTPLKLPSMNIFKQMAQAREVGAKEIAPIKSVVQQIDEVLQHLIVGTPFARQNLHVAAGPTGNVLFEVGAEVYNTVDEIPDRSLQVVFQEAIRRWEQAR
jgi:hypothetical protein